MQCSLSLSLSLKTPWPGASYYYKLTELAQSQADDNFA